MRSLDFPFRIDHGAIAMTSSYDRIVRNQLLDVVITNRYERVMRPDYGANVSVLLFDPSDALVRHDASSYLKMQCSQQCPRATVTEVRVEVDQFEPNIVRVEIIYTSRFVADSLVVKVDTGDNANG